MGVKIQLVGVQHVTPMQRKGKEVIAVPVKPIGSKKHQLYIQIVLIGDFVIQNVVADMEMRICFRQEYNSYQYDILYIEYLNLFRKAS